MDDLTSPSLGESVRTFHEYHTHVQQKVAQSKKSDDWNAIKMIGTGRKEGAIRGKIRFEDGATLSITEEIVIDEAGSIQRPIYAYHYERTEDDGLFFFRYDRDPEHARPIVHEECHLHVNHKDRRFKTHATSFDEVFDFILATFYEASGPA